MVRIAKEPDPQRIQALKRQIQDEDYLDAAIQRLAHKLTEKIVERRHGDQNSPKTSSQAQN